MKKALKTDTEGFYRPDDINLTQLCQNDNKQHRRKLYTGASIPMGQGGHAPPQYLDWGDIITNVPPNISRVISATFYPCNIFLISWKSF